MRPALALAAALVVTAPAAGATRLTLPSPTAPVREEPPLRTPTPPFASTERRFPQRVDARAVVHVGVDSSGEPLRMTALDRVVVRGTGDYSFAISAPATAVTAGPGSQSQPGLRPGAVLWQGFSANHRVLVARIALDPGRAAKALPVELKIDRGEVRIANVTGTTARVVTGNASPAAVAGAVAAARSAVARGELVPAPTIALSGAPRTTRVEVRTRLRVTGSYVFAGGTRTVASWLGAKPLTLRGSGRLRSLALRVVGEDPSAPLRPTGSAELATKRLLESALANQYRSFLENPDPAGRSGTSYLFTLASNVDVQAASGNGSSTPWAAIVAAVAAVSAAAAAVVVWAHS